MSTLLIGAAAILILVAAQNKASGSTSIIGRDIVSPANATVGGAPLMNLPQNAYNPVGPANLLNYQPLLSQSNSLPTLTNTQTSFGGYSWDEPANSQTPHTSTEQPYNITGVQQSFYPVQYGTFSKYYAASAVTPTSYNYSNPISAVIIPDDMYPMPQYILNQQLTGSGARPIVSLSSF